MGLARPSEPFDPYVDEAVHPLRTSFPVENLPDGAKLGREDRRIRFKKFGIEYELRIRDKVGSEDWLLASAQAVAFALRRNEVYLGTPPGADHRNALLQSDVVI